MENQKIIAGIKQMEEGLNKIQTEVSKMQDPWIHDYAAILEKRLETLKTAIEVEVLEKAA